MIKIPTSYSRVQRTSNRHDKNMNYNRLESHEWKGKVELGRSRAKKMEPECSFNQRHEGEDGVSEQVVRTDTVERKL